MLRWSEKILGKPLLILNVPEKDCLQVSAFESQFGWNLGENSIVEFSLKALFLSEQFKDFLGYHTFLLFEVLSPNGPVAQFAFKVSVLVLLSFWYFLFLKLCNLVYSFLYLKKMQR